MGTYDSSAGFNLITSFDYNKTLIGLMEGKAYFYWNTSQYSGLNPFPSLSFSP